MRTDPIATRPQRPTSVERAILSALAWGHITVEQAKAKLGDRAADLLHGRVR